MGVVERQTIIASAFKYLGLLLGLLSTIFVYPFGLSLYGFISFIQDTVLMILPFSLLGVPQAGLKFFPYFKNSNKKHHDFLTFMLTIGLLGFCIIGGVVLIFNYQLIEYYFVQYKDESWLNFSFFPKILLLLFLINWNQIFQTYCDNHLRIAIQSIIELGLKIGIPLIVIGHIYSGWSLDFCLNLYIGIYFLSMIGYVLYIKFMNRWYLGFSFIPFLKREKILRPYIEFSLYSIIGGLSTVLIARVDTIMVGMLSDLDTTGVYKISIVIANIVYIPYLAISKIITPLVSGHLKQENYQQVGVLYKDISIVALISGIFFSIGILEGMEIFYLIHPKGAVLKEGYLIILFTILSILVNMGSSINGSILSMSKYYRINLWITISVAIFNTILNYILIKAMGITGVAIASLVSLLLINGINISIIYNKFKIHPFQLRNFYLLLFSIVLYLLIFILLPAQQNLVLKFIYLIIFSIIYVVGIYYLKFSNNINKKIDYIFKRIGLSKSE